MTEQTICRPRPSHFGRHLCPTRSLAHALLLAVLGLNLAHPGHAASSGGAGSARAIAGKVDFNREIRPILSENCFKCHGPDGNERKAKLRFDRREEALRPAKSGQPAIVPGAPEKSQLLARVTATDPDDRMPPVKSGKKLTPGQIEMLRRWIAEGAPYARHWAYVPPVRPPLPTVKHARWARNAVDRFILARLEREGLKPSPEADRYTLVRRASLDLTGLPPTIEQVDRFVKDRSPDAYEKLVDHLLAEPAFGEHWARLWLDLVRYADSAGYADDPPRTIWAFRDYVIRSFNQNKPFDQFTIEQIAGDLLPDPDEDQLVATACHRNTMTNNEGGTSDEEFRNAAVVDRVNTTMAVWMATSMGCAQCHTHKYDPISQQEYFRFFALFNNSADADKPDESPVLSFYTEKQKSERARWEAEGASLRERLKTPTPALLAQQKDWEGRFPRSLPWQSLRPSLLESSNGANLAVLEDDVVLTAPGQKANSYSLDFALQIPRLTGLRLEALPHSSLPKEGAGLSPDGSFIVSRIAATLLPPGPKAIEGRFVRVELPGKDRILSLAEVQVSSGEDNVARQGVASQSSTAYDGPARLAIDGNTDGDYEKAKSTTHTESSENPWWEVDLKASRRIDRIVIWNRTGNGLEARLSNFHVRILDEQRQSKWEQAFPDPPNPSRLVALDGSRPLQFSSAFADSSSAGFAAESGLTLANKKQGWSTGPGDGRPHWLVLLPEQAVDAAPGSKVRVTIERNAEAEQLALGCFRISVCEDAGVTNFARIPGSLTEILLRPPKDRTSSQEAALTDYYLGKVAPDLQPTRDRLAEVQKQLAEIKPNTVPVMRELTGDQRRKTHLQFRGNYLALGEEVTPDVPAAFHPLPPSAPPDRLALARWLVAPENPLTARVIANRFWEQVFGVGIVRTSEDFGSQGDLPSNPELLDWLARELVARQWNVKEFLKLLVTSAAYRQSSRVSPALAERDPDNLLLARGPRFRMSAEVVRDQALAVSGLLSRKMFGPSIRPPRPALGLSAAFGSSLDWKTSEGEDRFRRGLYVEWRRTSPYPSMAAFDAPNREVCTLRRVRSNTPLQALVTLNDPVYVEAAQALARRMVAEANSPAERARHGFRLCLARPPAETELRPLLDLYQAAHADYEKEPAKAQRLATEPRGPLPANVNAPELAAWTAVANVLLNLDEMFMRR